MKVKDAPCGEQFDIVVIGAGPAGAMVARESAKRGASVLLVDHARFPRHKVCGCCINQPSLAVLQRAGLGDLTHLLGAPMYDGLRLYHGRCCASLRLPRGVSVSRSAFDDALVRAAVEVGVEFRDGCHASLAATDENGRIVEIRHMDSAENSGCKTFVRASIVIAANGLGGRLLDHESGMTVDVSTGSRMGIGGVVHGDASSFYEPGVIHMACGRRGYVGLVRLEDGSLDVAAAMDATFVKARGGPGCAIATVLDECHMPMLPQDAIDWRGTPLLTRRRAKVVGRRLFVVGDAAGYIEPFTGEGIAWALRGGAAVAPIAVDAIHEFTEKHAKRWAIAHSRIVGWRQQVCRVVARTLRSPLMTAAMIRLLNQMPAAAGPIVSGINSHGQDGVSDNVDPGYRIARSRGVHA